MNILFSDHLLELSKAMSIGKVEDVDGSLSSDLGSELAGAQFDLRKDFWFLVLLYEDPITVFLH